MTVKELIKELLDAPQDAVILRDRDKTNCVGHDTVNEVAWYIPPGQVNAGTSVASFLWKKYD